MMKDGKKVSLLNVDDKICEIKMDMEKTRVLLEQLEIEHFNKANISINSPDIKILKFGGPIFELLYNYDSNSTIFEIMYDYVVSMADKIQELQDSVDVLRDKEELKEAIAN